MQDMSTGSSLAASLVGDTGIKAGCGEGDEG